MIFLPCFLYHVLQKLIINLSTKIMQEILTTFMLFILGLVFYIIWIRPQKQMKNYAKCLTNRGYKVKLMPYNPLNIHLVRIVNEGSKRGDAMIQYKQDFQDYDVIVCNFFIWPQLEFLHPDFIKDFYSVDKHYQYPKQQQISLFYSGRLGQSLVFSEGALWRRKRNILNRVFNFDFIKSQTNKISQICDQAMDKVQRDAKNNSNQKFLSLNILDLNSLIFSEVMMAIFLGSTKNEEIMGVTPGKLLIQIIDDLTEQLFNPINLVLGPKYVNLGLTKNHRQVNTKLKSYQEWGVEYASKRIKQITQKLNQTQDISKISSPKDIIQALLIQKMNSKSEILSQQLDVKQDEIFNQMTVFTLAGTDTTSHYTLMMMYLIVLNPTVQEKLRQEIKNFMSKDDYSYDNLKNFKYLDNIQKQTTRFYGPGSHLFERFAKVDNFLNGIAIKKGTSVQIVPMKNHYSQKYFKNPKQFRPERWEDECDNIPPFVLGGFSAGSRACIGKSLALIESKIAIIQFFKGYKKIVLGKTDFKMGYKFLYYPEEFQTKLFYE